MLSKTNKNYLLNKKDWPENEDEQLDLILDISSEVESENDLMEVIEPLIGTKDVVKFHLGILAVDSVIKKSCENDILRFINSLTKENRHKLTVGFYYKGSEKWGLGKEKRKEFEAYLKKIRKLKKEKEVVKC